MPAAWAGRRIVLHVGAAESVLLVTLNGHEVGISKDSHLAAEFDVTSVLRPGANDLRLTVVKWSDASFIEDQDQWWHGGITRPVFLYATAPTYLADLVIDAGLDADRVTGTVKLEVGVGFPDDPPEAGWRVEATVEGLAEPLRADHRQRAAARAGSRRLGRAGAAAPRRPGPREPQRRRRADRSRRRRALAAGRVARAPAADRAGEAGCPDPGRHAVVRRGAGAPDRWRCR